MFASNVFSEVNGRFDMIISNPPFHDGLQTSQEAAQTLIRGAVRHLNSGGEPRIVANAFLPYPDVIFSKLTLENSSFTAVPEVSIKDKEIIYRN